MNERFKPEHLKKEADRLTHEPVLLLAIENARKEAIKELLKTPADDLTAISKWQQRVAALDEIPKQLRRFIIALADAE